MARNGLLLVLTLLLLSGSLSSAAVSPSPSRVVNGALSNAVSKLMKLFRPSKAPKKAAARRPTVKFESGYTVETVFDGSKLGIEPHTVEVLPSGELLILDSANSNIYKISSSLSQYTRPRLIAGSAEGHSGHVDGKKRDARLNHPKGLTVDHKGNIYIADADNMAIRKISETGMTTIAGGKGSRGGSSGGHVDGPSEDAKFSTDFDVVYIGSSCSLLVIDRGNQAIREIQLHFDDCSDQYESGFPLGIAVLLTAGFFGYMLALLQRRVGSIVSSEKDEKTVVSYNPNEKRVMTSPSSSSPGMQPLFPHDGPEEKQEETFFGSMGKLAAHTGECLVDILGSIFPAFIRRKPQGNHIPPYHQLHNHPNTPWQAPPDSYDIPRHEVPPPIDTRSPTPKKEYAFGVEGAYEKMISLRESSERTTQDLYKAVHEVGPTLSRHPEYDNVNYINHSSARPRRGARYNYGQ
ncbi:unnamed protein product [Cuscuta campestris]|uniref:Teneurin NHL domain-containing protein n=2 Tax=Cuscuta sect. Cleistogrammica TaxID=1824901 RepID=A0A484MXJ1_9ASTE|nr:hypothetical protein DM860_006926 [Cuscuta australis]VFQ93157.1 unnamed protein product [Cuscuta campestris]